jgi:outer membrane scaffolding protein for murein synthesis (MipA/OmpV family)
MIVRRSDFDAVWGFYVRVNASWQLGKHWSAVGDLQYHDLGKYQHSFGGPEVALDLSNALFVTLGLSYRF